MPISHAHGPSGQTARLVEVAVAGARQQNAAKSGGGAHLGCNAAGECCDAKS
jgi:hypothetical protein